MDKQSSTCLGKHICGGQKTASHLVCEYFVETGGTTEEGGEQVLGLNSQILRTNQVESQAPQLDDVWIQSIHELGECKLAIAWRYHCCVSHKISHIKFQKINYASYITQARELLLLKESALIKVVDV